MGVETCKRKKDKEDKMTEKMTKKLTAKEKQHRGDLYLPGDEEIMKNSSSVWKNCMILIRPVRWSRRSGRLC